MSAGLKHRIFVVDDESIIASSLQLILMSQGFDAHSFADPLAALNAARSKSPDLLITDVMMPQMTGIELAVQIRQDCPSTTGWTWFHLCRQACPSRSSHRDNQ